MRCLKAIRPNKIRYTVFLNRILSPCRQLTFEKSKPNKLFNILLTINGKSGVDISQLSAYKSEGEVLMPRHTVYRVLNQYEKDGIIHIELEEVSEKQWNGKIIMQLSLLKG